MHGGSKQLWAAERSFCLCKICELLTEPHTSACFQGKIVFIFPRVFLLCLYGQGKFMLWEKREEKIKKNEKGEEAKRKVSFCNWGFGLGFFRLLSLDWGREEQYKIKGRKVSSKWPGHGLVFQGKRKKKKPKPNSDLTGLESHLTNGSSRLGWMSTKRSRRWRAVFSKYNLCCQRGGGYQTGQRRHILEFMPPLKSAWNICAEFQRHLWAPV